MPKTTICRPGWKVPWLDPLIETLTDRLVRHGVENPVRYRQAERVVVGADQDRRAFGLLARDPDHEFRQEGGRAERRRVVENEHLRAQDDGASQEDLFAQLRADARRADVPDVGIDVEVRERRFGEAPRADATLIIAMVLGRQVDVVAK